MYLTQSSLLSPVWIMRNNSVCTMGSKTEGLNVIVKPLFSLVSSSQDWYLIHSSKSLQQSLSLPDIPHTSFSIFPPFCNKVPSVMQSICLLLLALNTGFHVAWNCSWIKAQEPSLICHVLLPEVGFLWSHWLQPGLLPILLTYQCAELVQADS